MVKHAERKAKQFALKVKQAGQKVQQCPGSMFGPVVATSRTATARDRVEKRRGPEQTLARAARDAAACANRCRFPSAMPAAVHLAGARSQVRPYQDPDASSLRITQASSRVFTGAG